MVDEKPSLATELARETDAVDRTFGGGLAEGERLTGVEFDGCTFEGSVLVAAKLSGCTFTECVFTGVDLSRVQVTDSRFAECRFEDCKVLAVNFALGHTSTLAPPFTFERCRLDYASFRGLDVTGSAWRDCRLVEADFGEAVARRCDFAGSELSRAVFGQTDLREANFVGALNYDFDIRDNQVRGARFDATEAARLLLPFGVDLV